MSAANDMAPLGLDRLVSRFCEIWVRLLRNPRYDNGDTSIAGGMAMILAAQLPNNATEPLLEAFRIELFAAVKSQVEIQLKRDARGLYVAADVDYGPCEMLAKAAQAAGLDLQFPWKTRVTLRNDCVTAAAGYAAPSVYHYPLRDDRWLICQLCGEDMPKIIEAVESGHLTALTVETPPAIPEVGNP